MVNIDSGAAIAQASVAECNLNIYTFNEDFIEENISWNSIVKSIFVDDQKILELTNSAKPDQKAPITFSQQIINQETFTKAKESLADLLKISVVSETIQRLVEHGDVNPGWKLALTFTSATIQMGVNFVVTPLLKSVPNSLKPTSMVTIKPYKIGL